MVAQNIETIVQELDDFAHHDNTERGEYWSALVHTWELVMYNYDETFYRALEEEIRNIHKYIRVNYSLVEETKTFEHTTKRLVWKEDM